MSVFPHFSRNEIRLCKLFIIFSLVYCVALYILKEYFSFAYSEELLVIFALPIVYTAYRYQKHTFLTIAFLAYIISFSYMFCFHGERLESLLLYHSGYLIVCVSCYFVNREITKRWEIENVLKLERDKLFSILSHAPDRISVIDKDFNVVFVSKSLEDMYQVCLGRKCYEMYCKRGAPCQEECPVREIIHNKKSSYCFTKTFDVGTGNGPEDSLTKKVYEFHAYPVTIDGKQCVVEFARDISALTLAEMELRKSQKKLIEREKIYRDAIELAGCVPYYLNYETDNYEFVGSGIKQLLGYEPHEFGRREWEQCEKECFLLENMKGMAARDAVQKAKAGNEPKWHANYRLETTTGEERWVSDSAIQIKNEQGVVIGSIGLLQDITPMVLQEKDRILLETAVEQAAESIVITDRDASIIYVNPFFEKVTGYTKAEAVGQNPRILKSGKYDEFFYKEMWSALSTGNVWTGFIINQKKNGELYEEEATISPIMDSYGTIINYVAVKRDVTERKQLEKRLLQSQKMEAIGSLAGGIAHDFNNILTATMGYAELVRSQLPPGGDLFNQQTQIIRASIRAKELVDQILTFSRQTEQEKQSIFFAPIVKEAIKLLSASIPKNIEIRSFIDADEATIFGDPTQIHQVIMNLCTNAYHAMREKGGVMTISLSCKPLKTIDVKNLTALPENQYCVLTISDTGTGMDESTIARVFEPYFSTKKKGEGTGLGLSVVHGIIQDHHGMIDIQSELGKGTTVTAAFPVLAMQGEHSQNAVEDLPLGDGERIMVIDDEWPIVEMMKITLRQLKYKPDGFVSCRDALEVFRKNPGHYQLIITDLSMPHLSGLEVAKKILEIRPDMPILLCTGYVDQAFGKMIESVKFSEVLMKPVLQKDAAEAIRRCLHHPTFH